MSTLYHYCPTNSFYSIVENRSIWLTSLSQSNDYMEGKLASLIIARLAQRDNLDPHAIQACSSIIQTLEETYEGLGFCLSKEKDLLSQWRGYASDATGVAVGFSTEYFAWLVEATQGKSLRLELKEVIYDAVSHDSLAEPTYTLAKQYADELLKIPGHAGTSFQDELLLVIKMAGVIAPIQSEQLFKKLFLLKSNAFREEHEWRLMSLLSNNGTDVCSYRLQNNIIARYQILELPELGRLPIAEVILGPKHPTPVGVVRKFLRSNGFGDVNVIQSKTTYR